VWKHKGLVVVYAVRKSCNKFFHFIVFDAVLFMHMREASDARVRSLLYCAFAVIFPKAPLYLPALIFFECPSQAWYK
jgi:hypothetical protein